MKVDVLFVLYSLLRVVVSYMI